MRMLQLAKNLDLWRMRQSSGGTATALPFKLKYRISLTVSRSYAGMLLIYLSSDEKASLNSDSP